MKFTSLIVRLLAMLGLFAVLSGSRCNDCLDVPQADTTAPSSGALVEYYQGGRSLTKSLTADEASITLTSDENRPVSIAYSGQDEEGMKSVQIFVKVYRDVGGIQQSQDFTVAPVQSSCPKKVLLGMFTLGKDEGARVATFSIRSTNWLGMQTTTQQHTVSIE